MPPKRKSKPAGKPAQIPKRGLKQKNPVKKETRAQKRRKKVDKKFIGIEFDNIPCNSLDRDELERVANTLRSDLQETRADRVLMQLQRDYFTEIILVYFEKIRNNREHAKLKRAEFDNAQYDVQIRDGLIHDKEFAEKEHWKRLIAESFNNRQNRLKRKRAKRALRDFEFHVEDMEECEQHKQKQRKARPPKFAEYEEEVSDLETAEKRDFAKRFDFMDKQDIRRARWNAILDKDILLELDYYNCDLTERTYEIINEQCWVFFKVREQEMKHQHNQWNFIAYDFYHWDDIDVDTRFMEIQIELYAKDQIGLEKYYNKTYWPYIKVKTNRRTRLRLDHHRGWHYDLIRRSELDMAYAMHLYAEELWNHIIVDYEIRQLKQGLRHLTTNCWTVFRERFELDRYEKKATEAQGRYMQLRQINQSFYEKPEDEIKDFNVARDYMYETDEVTQAQRFESIRIKKQHDDTARSMNTRADRLGRERFYSRHSCYKPKPQKLIGRQLNLGDRAAGLVANPFYPMRGQDFKILDIFSKEERTSSYPRLSGKKREPEVDIFRNASNQSQIDKTGVWV